MLPSFAFLVVSIVPAQGKFSGCFRLLFDYDDCRKKVVAWHRAELEKLDHVFQIPQAAFKLAVAREKAREREVGPLDENYQTLFDLIPAVERQLREP